MKPYAEAFYKSKAWKDCREAYAKSKGWLCERCMKEGRLTTGEIVHHKIHITPENISDPSVTLNWDNLELLCKDCHDEEREKKNVVRRWRCGPDGRLMPPLVGER